MLAPTIGRKLMKHLEAEAVNQVEKDKPSPCKMIKQLSILLTELEWSFLVKNVSKGVNSGKGHFFEYMNTMNKVSLCNVSYCEKKKRSLSYHLAKGKNFMFEMTKAF